MIARLGRAALVSRALMRFFFLCRSVFSDEHEQSFFPIQNSVNDLLCLSKNVFSSHQRRRRVARQMRAAAD